GLSALMLVNTMIVHHGLPRVDPPGAKGEASALFRPQPSYFAVLALAILLVATWNNTSREQFPLVLAAEGLLLTFSVYLLQVREVTLLSQGYLVVAQLAWFFNWFASGQNVPWWNAVLLIV